MAEPLTTRARVGGPDLDAARRRCADLLRLSAPGIARVTGAEVEADGEVRVTVALPAGTIALASGDHRPGTDTAVLRILGQVALAVAGLQARAMSVGQLDLGSIRLRADGDALLVGLASAATCAASRDDDARALVGLLDTLGQTPTARTRQVSDLLSHRPLPDAAEIGRTALAAAVADPERLATAAAVRPRPMVEPPERAASRMGAGERRDTDRVRVRNRMLGLGVLVVLVGLVLLKTLSGSSSRIEVPTTTGRTETQAVAALHRAGLQAHEILVASSSPTGTVLGSTPVAGSRLAAGTTVTLRVSGGAHPTGDTSGRAGGTGD